ncbi:MAG TPA: sulfite oxidase [Ilumatobacteraceae bacterium]
MNDTTTAEVSISLQELQLATRNHGMPLEALRYAVTPVGLHYLLTHFDMPMVDADTWHLRIDGCVERHLELSLADLQAMPTTTRVLTMECAGNGRAMITPRPSSQPWLVEAVGTGEWTGVELRHVLDAAGLTGSALEVVFTGADRGVDGGENHLYQRSITVDTATSSGVLLAYRLNGGPLPPQHGFPLRVVVPRWYGMSNVKWLTSISVVDEPFNGYQQRHSYRLRQEEDEVGEPLSQIYPRSLMVPPGIPEFMARSRLLPAGRCDLFGRAWSGKAPIAEVDVSVDGGATWAAAELEPPPADPGAWIGWRYQWDAVPGEHELCCRATDAEGNTQAAQPTWNRGGYVNNSFHRIPVQVHEA